MVRQDIRGFVNPLSVCRQRNRTFIENGMELERVFVAPGDNDYYDFIDVTCITTECDYVHSGPF